MVTGISERVADSAAGTDGGGEVKGQRSNLTTCTHTLTLWDIQLQMDEPLVEAILGVFITMATSREGAESLLVSGLLQVLSLPLCSCLDNKLNPAPLTSQVIIIVGLFVCGM